MNLLLALVLKCSLSLCVFVFLFSKGQDANAAQCHKPSFHRWRCSPCGRGTRCIFCQWCLCYCFKGNHTTIKRSTDVNETLPEYGNEETPYKKPLIEMFRDLETLIQKEEISNIEIVELYKVTSEALSKDCEICDDVPEIEELRKVTKSIHEKLE